MELVLEQITRNNKVLQFYKLSGDIIRIGRAYDNDLILRDEHICPYHAQLSINETGEVIITDLDSLNGISNKSNQAINSSTAIAVGEHFILGKLRFRIADPMQLLAKTTKLNFLEQFSSRANQWYCALAFIITVFAMNILGAFLSASGTIVWTNLISESTLEVIALAVIALLIAVGARIFKHEIKLFSIIVLSFAFALSLMAFRVLGDFLMFNWGQNQLLSIGNEVIRNGLLFVFIWGCFFLVSNMNFKRITMSAAVLILSFFGLTQLQKFGDDSVVLVPQYSVKILPSTLLIRNATSVKQHLENNTQLFSETNAEAQRRNQEAKDSN
jgi:hypothetical protein